MKRYLITLLITLMVPAMVLSMGLEDDVELKDGDAKNKVAAQHRSAVPSLFDLCKQELIKNGVAGKTEQEKEKNTFDALNVATNRQDSYLHQTLVHKMVPQRLFPLPAKKIATLLPNNENLNVVFNSASNRVLTYSIFRAEAVRVYNSTNTKKPLFTLNRAYIVKKAIFSKNGTRIVTLEEPGETDSYIHVWNAHDGTELYSFSIDTKIRDFALNPINDDQIIVACYDQSIRLYEKNQQIIIFDHPIDEGRNHINRIAFSSDGKTVATAVGPFICLWDISSGHFLHKFEGVDGYRLSHISFSGDSNRLIAITHKDAYIWNIPARTLQCTLNINTLSKQNNPEDLNCASLNSDGSQLILAPHKGDIYICNALTGNLLHTLPKATTYRHTEFALFEHFEHLGGKTLFLPRLPFSPDNADAWTNSVTFDTNNNDHVIVSTSAGAWVWDLAPLKALTKEITPEQYALLEKLEKAFGQPDYIDLSWDEHETLDSFGSEAKKHITATYKISKHWLYECSKPKTLLTIAKATCGVAATYLGWKLFKR